MPKPNCAVCGHAEGFHGVSDRAKGALFDGVHYCRFGQVQDGPDRYMITCRCGHYEPMREEPNGIDSPASGDSPSLPVAGLPVDRVAAQQRLAALEGELTAGAEDLVAGIRGVGKTMADGAARLRGDGA